MSKSSPLGAGLSRRRIIKATAALAAGIAAPNVMRMTRRSPPIRSAW